jgi:hypothetical protein
MERLLAAMGRTTLPTPGTAPAPRAATTAAPPPAAEAWPPPRDPVRAALETPREPELPAFAEEPQIADDPFPELDEVLAAPVSEDSTSMDEILAIVGDEPGPLTHAEGVTPRK